MIWEALHAYSLPRSWHEINVFCCLLNHSSYNMSSWKPAYHLKYHRWVSDRRNVLLGSSTKHSILSHHFQQCVAWMDSGMWQGPSKIESWLKTAMGMKNSNDIRYHWNAWARKCMTSSYLGLKTSKCHYGEDTFEEKINKTRKQNRS